MRPRTLHPLEIRPFRETRVHAGAFARIVETIQNFDGLSQDDAATEALAMLDRGEFALKTIQGHAAYLATGKIDASA